MGGKTAVKEIWNVMNNPKAASASVILPVELVVRESCGGDWPRLLLLGQKDNRCRPQNTRQEFRPNR